MRQPLRNCFTTGRPLWRGSGGTGILPVRRMENGLEARSTKNILRYATIRPTHAQRQL